MISSSFVLLRSFLPPKTLPWPCSSVRKHLDDGARPSRCEVFGEEWSFQYFEDQAPQLIMVSRVYAHVSESSSCDASRSSTCATLANSSAEIAVVDFGATLAESRPTAAELGPASPDLLPTSTKFGPSSTLLSHAGRGLIELGPASANVGRIRSTFGRSCPNFAHHRPKSSRCWRRCWPKLGRALPNLGHFRSSSPEFGPKVCRIPRQLRRGWSMLG